MERTTETILRMIRTVLFHEALPETWDSGIDWTAVLAECRRQAIVPLFVDILPKLPLPASVFDAWKKQIVGQALQDQKLICIQSEIDGLFRRLGIRYATLKGFAASQYYEQPLQRTMGDIDVLVLRDDVERAIEALRETGFSPEGENELYPRHIGLTKAEVHVELHRYFGITEAENAVDAGLHRLLTVGLTAAARSIPIPGSEPSEGMTCSVFDDTRNGLILLYHIGQHLPSGLGYRQILDFLLYAALRLDDEAWSGEFGQYAAELELDTLAKAVVRMGQIYFGVPGKFGWCADAGDDLAAELLDYITGQGNFGRKDGSDVAHVLNTSRGSILSRLRYEQKSGLVHWKAARKHAVLRPFAWIYGIGHHARVMTKRGLWKRLRGDLIASRQQSGLLDRLNVKQRYNM